MKKMEIETNNCFYKITSKIVLKKIFNNLEKERTYEIIRYNKNIRTKLNITLNDFKELSDKKVSPIIIEIKPAQNKYGKVFNNEGSRSYYHMYFDDEKKKKKGNKLEKEDKVSKIKLVTDHQVESLNNLFEDCKCIESINFTQFIRININDMRGMFWQCSSLKEIELKNFVTNNVTNMSWMFYRCSELKKINISNFNLDNVTNMTGMFWGCSSLEDIILPEFKDDNDIKMRCMFSECSDDLKSKVKEQNKKIDDEAFE